MFEFKIIETSPVLPSQFTKSNGVFIRLQDLKKVYSEEISSNLSIIVNQCENVFVSGDLNFDFLNPK